MTENEGILYIRNQKIRTLYDKDLNVLYTGPYDRWNAFEISEDYIIFSNGAYKPEILLDIHGNELDFPSGDIVFKTINGKRLIAVYVRNEPYTRFYDYYTRELLFNLDGKLWNSHNEEHIQMIIDTNSDYGYELNWYDENGNRLDMPEEEQLSSF